MGQPARRVWAPRGFSSPGATLPQSLLPTGGRKPPLEVPLCYTGTALGGSQQGRKCSLLSGGGGGAAEAKPGPGLERQLFHVSGGGCARGEAGGSAMWKGSEVLPGEQGL